MTDWIARRMNEENDDDIQELKIHVRKLEREFELFKQQIKPKTMQDLKDIDPITEANKGEWINWLGENIDYIEQGNHRGDYTTHRVFKTDKDDADEILNVLRTMFVTLQQSTIEPITRNGGPIIVKQQCPDCKADLEVDLSTGNLKFIKHNT